MEIKNFAGDGIKSILWVEQQIANDSDRFKISWRDSNFEDGTTNHEPRFREAFLEWFRTHGYSEKYRVYTGGCNYGDTGWIGFLKKTPENLALERAPGMWGRWEEPQ